MMGSEGATRGRDCDVLVVGGGAAGLAAAAAAAGAGASVLVVERDEGLGGILNQCIHNGFGLHRFGEELTGPEYAAREVSAVAGAGGAVRAETGASVLALARAGAGFSATVVSAARGQRRLTSGAVVLACGCRERTRGEVGIAGTRPAGVLTAGCAQRLCNVDGVLAGRRVVVLGSGDIGLIMARRMTWEGARVLCVCELASEPGGLRRNIVQCLEDNGIPLHLSTTVTRVMGSPRLEAVELASVDPATRRPIPGTERVVECDALLLSVGLIPDNTLARGLGAALDPGTRGPAVDECLETSVPGLFVAGNELHVHDLVDFVSEEGALAGASAAAHALGRAPARREGWPEAGVAVRAGEGVAQLAPQRVSGGAGEVTVRLRTRARIEGARILVTSGGRVLRSLRRRVVVPSEMQELRLRADDLAQVSGDVEVSCVAEEGR